jgi:glycerophosphoryl diester phosphodiesterase
VNRLAAALIVSTFAAAQSAEISQPGYHNRPFTRDCCLVISHAGGAFQGRNYSNSLEALNASFAIGRRVFEIDFSFTSDGAVALTHDWAHWNGARPEDGNVDAPDADAFLSRKLPGGLSPLTLPGLEAWLDQHPDVLIVTDTKDDFSDFAEAFFAHSIDHRRFVFQVYDLDDLALLHSHADDAKSILSIYKLTIDADELIAGLREAEVDALAMPLKRTADDLPRLRAALPDLPIYVHGRPQRINTPQLHFHLKDLGASGYYLD